MAWALGACPAAQKGQLRGSFLSTPASQGKSAWRPGPAAGQEQLIPDDGQLIPGGDSFSLIRINWSCSLPRPVCGEFQPPSTSQLSYYYYNTRKNDSRTPRGSGRSLWGFRKVEHAMRATCIPPLFRKQSCSSQIFKEPWMWSVHAQGWGRGG